MPSQVPTPEGNLLRFESRDNIPGTVEAQLKNRFGRGIYTHDVTQTPSGDLIINLGSVVPKDLSDSREQDNVIKFVPIDNIYQLHAEPTNGSYLIDLPERDVVVEGFQERRQEIVNRVDLTMARTIYQDIAHFGEVNNQLAPIRQILHWARTRSPVHVQEINSNQPSDQTLDYISVLEELGYIHVDDEGYVYAGEALDSIDLNDVPSARFTETILGDVVRRGYDVLRDRLNLRILTHYPMISGAYYFDAIQREDPNLWLDVERIIRNIVEDFGGDRYKPLYIEEKLAQLSRVGVLEKDGDFVTSKTDVFNHVDQSLNGIA